MLLVGERRAVSMIVSTISSDTGSSVNDRTDGSDMVAQELLERWVREGWVDGEPEETCGYLVVTAAGLTEFIRNPRPIISSVRA